MGPKNNKSSSLSWDVELTRIIIKLISRRDTEPFRDPVPYQELGLTDYLKIVKTPMDLGTVKRKLEKKQYATADECARDIRLIWYNSMSYNAPNSKFYNLAKSLSEVWEKEWGSSLGKNDTCKPPSIEDLTIFAENSQRITPDDLGEILNILGNNTNYLLLILIIIFFIIIEKECPTSLYKNIKDNEVQINLDLIDGKTFKDVRTHRIVLSPTFININYID